MFPKIEAFLKKQIDSNENGIPLSNDTIEGNAELSWQILSDYVKHLDVLLDGAKDSFGEGYKEQLQSVNGRMSDLNKQIHFGTDDTLENFDRYEDDKYVEAFKSFFSSEYEPPFELVDLQYHLESNYLFHYFIVRHLQEVSNNLVLRMTYIMARLSVKATIASVVIPRRGMELYRINKSKKKRKTNSDKSRQKVIEEGYKISNREKMSLNSLAKLIKTRRGDDVPGLRQITRYLKEEFK